MSLKHLLPVAIYTAGYSRQRLLPETASETTPTDVMLAHSPGDSDRFGLRSEKCVADSVRSCLPPKANQTGLEQTAKTGSPGKISGKKIATSSGD